MRSSGAVAGVLAAVFWAGAAPAEPVGGLDAGLWRTVQTPEINGAKGPPRETVRCLTAEDVGDLERLFSPVSKTTNSPCELVAHDFTPQRLTWKLECRGQADQDVAGEFVFERRDRYSATVDARFSMLGKLMHHVRTAIVAERVGACP